jgi:hypothetical protein
MKTTPATIAHAHSDLEGSYVESSDYDQYRDTRELVPLASRTSGSQARAARNMYLPIAICCPPTAWPASRSFLSFCLSPLWPLSFSYPTLCGSCPDRNN